MELQSMFAPLAVPQSRWKAFLTSWGIQATMVASVVVLNAMFPQQIQQAKKFVVTNLVAPEPVINEPRPVNPRLVVKIKPVIEPPAVAKLVVPRQAREIRGQDPDVKAPDIKLTSKTPDPPRFSNVPIARFVATNTFTTPKNVMPTTTKPARQVQTGGFGDPNGIPATGDGKHGVNVAPKGDPGFPLGAVFGNGLGGSRGVPGVGIVANSVQSSGFDKQYGIPAQVVIATNELGSPVEIIEKPKPAYTEEGRKRGVEGEVRLEVQFTADGQVRVLRVLQGLGFGLDEQALHCAERIRFKPATHGGQLIDSTAVVHIVFELAS